MRHFPWTRMAESLCGSPKGLTCPQGSLVSVRPLVSERHTELSSGGGSGPSSGRPTSRPRLRKGGVPSWRDGDTARAPPRRGAGRLSLRAWRGTAPARGQDENTPRTHPAPPHRRANGVRRFDDFRRHVGLSEAVLADRLRKLVAAGILETLAYREPGKSYPARVPAHPQGLGPVARDDRPQAVGRSVHGGPPGPAPGGSPCGRGLRRTPASGGRVRGRTRPADSAKSPYPSRPLGPAPPLTPGRLTLSPARRTPTRTP